MNHIISPCESDGKNHSSGYGSSSGFSKMEKQLVYITINGIDNIFDLSQTDDVKKCKYLKSF